MEAWGDQNKDPAKQGQYWADNQSTPRNKVAAQLVDCPTRWSLWYWWYRSSSWRPWPCIGWGRMYWQLLRPQMAVLDHFFCKIYFLWVWRRKAFFWGHVGHFFGPWERFVKNEGGFPKRRGDFMLWSVFLMWYYETSLQSNTKTN